MLIFQSSKMLIQILCAQIPIRLCVKFIVYQITIRQKIRGLLEPVR